MSQTHSNGFFSNALQNLFRGAGSSEQSPQIQHRDDHDMTPAHRDIPSEVDIVDGDEDVDMPPLVAANDDTPSSASSPPALISTSPSHPCASPTDRPPPNVPTTTTEESASSSTVAQTEDSDDDMPDLLPTTRAGVSAHTSQHAPPVEDIYADMPELYYPTTFVTPAANDDDDEMPDLLPPSPTRRRARSRGARSNSSMPDLVSVSDSDSDEQHDDDTWHSEGEYADTESERDARDVEMMPDLEPVDDDGDSAWSDDSMPSLDSFSEASGPARRVGVEEVDDPDAPRPANANRRRTPQPQTNARPNMPPPPPFFGTGQGQDLPGFRQMFQPMLADIISRVTGQGGDLNWDGPVFGPPRQPGQRQPQMPPAGFWATGPPPPLNMPPHPNANANPPTNANPGMFPTLDDLFDLVTNEGGPNLPNLDAGNVGAGLFNLLFGLGGPLGQEQVEDPERAKRLIRGLDAVNDGMVKRITRVSEGEEGGSGLCAICWDSLLENEDADLWTKDKSKPAEERAQDSMDVDSSPSSPAGEAKEKEEPLPKVVALPCSHVFHTACLLPWFTRPHQTTCPSCRFDVDPESLTYEPRPRPTRPAPAPPAGAPAPGVPTTSGTAPGGGPQPQQQEPPRTGPSTVEELFRSAFGAPPSQPQATNTPPPAQPTPQIPPSPHAQNTPQNSPPPNAQNIPQNPPPPQQPPPHTHRHGDSIHIRAQTRFIPVGPLAGQVNPPPGQPTQRWEGQFIIPLPPGHGIPPLQQQPQPQPQQQVHHQPSPSSQANAAVPSTAQTPEQPIPPPTQQQNSAPGGQPQGPASNPQAQNPPAHPHPPGQPTNGPPHGAWTTVVTDIYIGTAGPFPPGQSPAPAPTAGSPPPAAQAAPSQSQGDAPPPPPPPPPPSQPQVPTHGPTQPQTQPGAPRPTQNGPSPQAQAQGAQGQRPRAFPFPMSQMTQGPDGTWFAFQPPNANATSGNPTAPRRPPQEKRAWVPPPPPGPTLRQRVEQQEREKGLRCDDVSCGVGPSDEDPEPVLDGRTKQMVSIRPHGYRHGNEGEGEHQRVCAHSFHLPCVVSAERVAGWGAEADEEKEVKDGLVEVGCPVCRAVGVLPLEEWEEGVRALETQMGLD